MGVAFYVLFLLVATPVKREDACKTGKQPGIIPTLTIVRPINDHQYEYGEEVILEWYKEKVTISKVWVWDTEIPMDTTQCEDIDGDQCKLRQLPSASYEWKVEGKSTGGQPIGVNTPGSFTIVAILPEISAHTFQYRGSIIVVWKIHVLKRLAKEYEILVWKLDDGGQASGDPIVHPVHCPDVQKCDEHKLQVQESGHYQCKVQVRTLKGNTGLSDKFYTFNVDIDKELPTKLATLYGQEGTCTVYFVQKEGESEQFKTDVVATPASCFVATYNNEHVDMFHDLTQVRLELSNEEELTEGNFIESVKVHSEYDDDPQYRENNIGLIKLRLPITVKRGVNGPPRFYGLYETWIKSNAKSPDSWIIPRSRMRN